MISFYKDEAGVVMFKDETHLETKKFSIDRPATQEDIDDYPRLYAASVGNDEPSLYSKVKQLVKGLAA